MDLRVSSGKFKKRKLMVPKNVRPVRSRIKLAVFSILGSKIDNADCADLCAGSGSLGIEALSMGAKSCVFVDNDYDAIKCMLRSGVLGTPDLKKEDVVKYIANTPEYYDIVFFDPPYDLPVRHALKLIHEIIKEDGIIVYFHSTKNTNNIEEINPNLKVVDTRTYGATTVKFIVATTQI